MRRLVWKDVVAARWFLIAALPLHAIQLSALVAAPPVFVLISVLFTALLAYGSIGLEEVQGTEALWCSLPVERRDVVLARYSATVLGTVLGLGMSWGIGRAALSWIYGDKTSAVVDKPGTYLVLLALFMLSAAVYLPCYFRLGAGRGVLAFAAMTVGTLVLLSAAGSLITYLAGGVEVVDSLRARDPQSIATAKAWLERWGNLMAAALLALAFLLLAASAALSARLYAARDC